MVRESSSPDAYHRGTMADGLTAFPARRASEDPQTAAWLANEGVLLTSDDRGSRGPTLAEVQALLERLGYPYQEGVYGFEERPYPDGTWPPFSELYLALDDPRGRARSIGFRLGPLEGPFQILRLVAEQCGTQVALSHSRSCPTVVRADTGWGDFYRGLYRTESTPEIGPDGVPHSGG